MFKVKIFTARGEGDVGKIYDNLSADVEKFINDPNLLGCSVEWHQSPQGEYSVRLTAIVSYRELVTKKL